MTTGGMVIRLIDVVLILLFGFISISEVTEKSDILLAESAELPAALPDKEFIVMIGVVGDGTFLVDNETKKVESPRDLMSYLLSQQTKLDEAGIKLRVRIHPAWNTPIKQTMYVAAICDQLSIPKSIAVRLIGKKEGE